MRKKIIFLTSHPMSITSFMLPHIRELNKHFVIKVFANTNDADILKSRGIDVLVDYAGVIREISPLRDIIELIRLYRIFRDEQPAAVHTLTPKAGLLGMCAAWLARIPLRVHTFTGQVWVTRSWPMRTILKFADKCIAWFSTDVLVDSPSQRAFLVENGVVSKENSGVLGNGSICGVDLEKFNVDIKVRQSVREYLEVDNASIVCLFLGRLNVDKGVFELANAFSEIAKKYSNIYLWFVGPDEGGVTTILQSVLANVHRQVRFVGFTDEPQKFMQAADLFCLPSHREGFGSSVIEAASCGVPALVSRIYGLTDAVVEGKTGWMHDASDSEGIALALQNISNELDQLTVRGVNARKYAENMFSEQLLTSAMLEFYMSRLFVSNQIAGRA